MCGIRISEKAETRSKPNPKGRTRPIPKKCQTRDPDEDANLKKDL